MLFEQPKVRNSGVKLKCLIAKTRILALITLRFKISMYYTMGALIDGRPYLRCMA